VTWSAARACAPSVEHALLAAVTARAPALLPSSVAERHMLRGICFLPLAEPVPRSVVALVSNARNPQPHAAEFVRLASALAQFGRPTHARPALVRAA
jgi:hypothetical protein